MSAANKIEDENIIMEAGEAEISNQNVATISEGITDTSFHKNIINEDEIGGKTKFTPHIQSSDKAFVNIDNSDAVNQNLNPNASDKSSGDHPIQSDNIKVIEDNKTDKSRVVVDDISINDNDITSQDVNNDIINKNMIDQSSQSKEAGNTIAPAAFQADIKLDYNDDDDMELKWDEGNDNFVGNDDDLMKDGRECDVSNEEQKVETLADESSMDIDDNNDPDLLNDNPIINKDNNDVDSTIGHSIENTEKETWEKTQNVKNVDMINENLTKTNTNTAISNDNKDLIDLKTPTNEEASSSQDMSIEDTSQLITKSHGIHGPDVMLEIPTQELIDIDDNDLSIILDQSDESPDVKNCTKMDEELTEKGAADDGNMTVEEPIVTRKVVELENVKDLEANVPEKASDNVNATLDVGSQIENPDKVLTFNTGDKMALDTSQKLPGETSTKINDSLNKLGPADNLDEKPKVSENTDLAPSNSLPADITNKLSEVTVSMDKTVSSSNMSPDITNQVPDVSESNNPQAASSDKLLQETDNLDTPVSSNKITQDKSDNVPEASDNINPRVTTSNENPEVTDNLGTLLSINKITPITPDNVPDVSGSISSQATTLNESPKVTDNLGTLLSTNTVTPDASHKMPEALDSITPQVTVSNELPEVTDNSGTLVSSNKMTPDTSDNVPEVSDTINIQATTSNMLPQVTDDLSTLVCCNNTTPDGSDNVPKVSGIVNQQDTPSNELPQSSEKLVSSETMIPDTSDELPEVSDSLGLLAESSRVMEDDDDQDDDEDGDDDDDFDQDESSNQISTAEHSEDSNAQHSESEANKDEKETDVSPAVESEREFQFMISSVESQGANKTDLEGNEKQQVDGDGSKQAASTTKSPEIISSTDQSKLSPSKVKKLELSSSAQPVFNIVDLEESSSEDDIQEINKEPEPTTPKPEVTDIDGVTSVNLPNDIEVMCTSAGSTSEIVTKEGEVVISGVPKPPPVKPARINTSEVSIKTASVVTDTLIIPEAKSAISDKTPPDTRVKPKLCLEIFSLDSDEEDTKSSVKEPPSVPAPPPPEPAAAAPPREAGRCANPRCGGAGAAGAAGAARAPADRAARLHYGVTRRARALLCQPCASAVQHAKQNLIRGIKDFTPLLELGVDKLSQELVEISDSESEDESEEPRLPSDTIGEKGAKLLEENLAAIINETWQKYNMDVRLKDTHDILDSELQKLENESKEIDQMLNDCQLATDKLRNELYATFERGSVQLPGFTIYDTPMYNYVGPEIETTATPPQPEPVRQSKRRLSIPIEVPAKKPAIPLGYIPINTDNTQHNKEESKSMPGLEDKADDDREVSVVKLSAEAAPADLPPPGEMSRPPLRVGASVFAMRNAFGPWLSGKILECQPKHASTAPYTMCRVKFDHKAKNPCKILSARCLAYSEPADVRMTIGTRIIALYKDPSNLKREQYFSGVVAEIPNPVNSYRYLVFFDDGYAQYVQHSLTRLVCESSSLVWEEVHPFSRQFVKDYLMAYPERPMVRLHEGQSLKTEWNGKWWPSVVARVDASLAQVVFPGEGGGRREWVYRGSTRLAPLYLEFQAAGRHRQRPMPRTKAQTGTDMPYVEYTRSEEQESNKLKDIQSEQQQNEELRRQRAVAKKSTATPATPAPPAPHALPPQQSNLDTVTSRVVYYTPKAAIKPYKMVPHTCGPKCKRTDVLSLKELRTYNPLAKPLLSGWERQIVRYKGHKEVMYRAPCGRRVRGVRELHRYLRAARSDLPVDLFDFHPATHCLAEFVLNKCRVGKKDLSHGKENVPVPCVNYYDDSLPEFCSYNTERTPTAGVPLNLDPDFLCGCDCADDCADKSKCACWKLTLEGARTIGLEGPGVGYEYKRLPEPLPSGIYECNSRCKCKATCLNRVAQHPLQLKLQVFKTLNRGWGIRALNDIPKGAFLCVYAGNLLTDATANLDGLNEGDEYLAELDYIEVVEQMKEGFEEDIPAADKRLDKKELAKQNDEESSEEDIPSSSDEGRASKSDKEDDDFMPGYIGLGVTKFNKALRKRDKAKKEEEEKDKGSEKEKEKGNSKNEEDCITISDDEEVREPSRFTAQAGMGANQFISKYRSVRSHFGKDEACYIMDAKVQGNIGRYLNHSCTPNVFVQNVFVDTHDPRFPWVAFFALSHIKAGTELTWNYNYDVGSVPGKVLYCFCGATNCRGRLL